MATADQIQQLLSRKAVACDNLLVRELSGEAILLNLDSGMYYGLDQVGFRMWTVLTAAESIGAAYQQLSSEYEVDREQLLKDVDQLVNDCFKQGLLELAPPR